MLRTVWQGTKSPAVFSLRIHTHGNTTSRACGPRHTYIDFSYLKRLFLIFFCFKTKQYTWLQPHPVKILFHFYFLVQIKNRLFPVMNISDSLFHMRIPLKSLFLLWFRIENYIPRQVKMTSRICLPNGKTVSNFSIIQYSNNSNNFQRSNNSAFILGRSNAFKFFVRCESALFHDDIYIFQFPQLPFSILQKSGFKFTRKNYLEPALQRVPSHRTQTFE